MLDLRNEVSKYFDRALADHDQSGDVWELAVNCMKRGKYEAAHELFLYLQQNDTLSPSIQFFIGLSLLGLNRLDLSHRHATEAINLHKSTGIHLNLELVNEFLDQYARILADKKKLKRERDGVSYKEAYSLPMIQKMPFMLDYEEHDKMLLWLPYIMFQSITNFSSDTVNTDGLGFRHSIGLNNKPLTLSGFSETEYNGFFGGSSAFGVGASRDSKTIPSILAQMSGDNWINMSQRGHVMGQCLMSALHYRPMRIRPKTFVLLCGANEMAANLTVPLASSHFDNFFNQSSFFEIMNNGLDSLIENTEYSLLEEVDINNVDIAALKNRMSDLSLTGLRNWSHLAASCGASLYYVLQPNAVWLSKKRLCEIESRIFSSLDKVSSNSFNKIKYVYKELYPWYCDMLEQHCKRFDVPFMNSNDSLDKNELNDEWLFVDRVHLTDKGYEIVSNFIYDGIKE